MNATNDTFTVRLSDRTDIWRINAESLAIGEPIAEKLGVTTEELFTGLSEGRFEMGDGPIDAESVPADFKVALPNDRELRNRIARAAVIDDTSIEELAWSALVSFVECIEEAKIFDADGSVIGDTQPLWPFRTLRFHDRKAGLEII